MTPERPTTPTTAATPATTPAPPTTAASPAARPSPCAGTPGRLPLPDGSTRIRVVELLASGTNGGAQEHVFNLVSRLDPSRYEPLVVSLTDGSAIHKLARHGIPTCVIDAATDAEAIEALAATLVTFGADVIHNHMHHAEVVGTQAAWRAADLGHRRPFIVGTVHSSRIRSEADRIHIRELTPRMDRLIAVSRSIVEKIAAEGREGPRVELIHNGVDLERYNDQQPCCTLRDEYGLPPDGPIVGVVARLEPEKGHATLLDAWPLVLRRYPDARLLIMGEGSQAESLQAQAVTLGIDREVIFTGRRDDVPAVTAALDVAVLPSYREAQGLSILEAMALGRPVVASNVGGIPEMIRDGVTGLLVPPHDPPALAAGILRFLDDHPLADTVARNARDMVHERFCVELMVRAIEAVYDQAVVPVEGQAAS